MNDARKLPLPTNIEGVLTVITQEFNFTASHSLPNHDGICKKRHPHDYKLEITISGPVQKEGPKEGMIFDFLVFEKIVKTEIIGIIGIMEYDFLPATFDFPTTIENLALWIGARLNVVLSSSRKEKIWVETVKLYEEPTRSATVKFPSPY